MATSSLLRKSESSRAEEGLAVPRVLRLVEPKSWQEYLEQFLLEKEVAGLRKSTLDDYRFHVTRFFAPVQSLEDFKAIEKRVQEYFGGEMAPATFNIRRAYLKAFFSYLVSQGALPANPITFPKRRDEGRARALPEDIVRKLLELPDRRTWAGLRNYVLILLILDTGIRPGEALRLFPEHFNLEAREVVVPAGVAKTRTSRTLPLSPTVVLWLKKLLAVRPPEWKNAPLFCTCDGRPMRRWALECAFKRYSRKLGFRITPYDLRHTFALYALREGMNPFALQRMLGHADLTMTKRYLALTKDDLKKEHERATPVARLMTRRMRGV